jgi:hypothetical protein
VETKNHGVIEVVGYQITVAKPKQKPRVQYDGYIMGKKRGFIVHVSESDIITEIR